MMSVMQHRMMEKYYSGARNSRQNTRFENSQNEQEDPHVDYFSYSGTPKNQSFPNRRHYILNMLYDFKFITCKSASNSTI